MGHKVHPNGFRLGVAHLECQVVCRQATTPTSSRRTWDPLAHRQATGQCQREPGGDRAWHQPRDGHGPHGQAGHRHRQGRRQRGVAATGRSASSPPARSSWRSRRSASRSWTRPRRHQHRQQLARRIAFRKAIKQAIQRTMKAGAKGVKIAVSGRLGGSEMARREWDKEGRIPLGTLRADISYGQVLSGRPTVPSASRSGSTAATSCPERTAPHEATTAAGAIAGGA
jgi:hypothetical protein